MAHPIRVTKSVLDIFLNQFETLSKRSEPTTAMKGRSTEEQGYYFVGQKRRIEEDDE